MLGFRSRNLWGALMASLVAAVPVRAVIVGGANGDGLNNAGESTLQGFLAASLLPTFPYFQNLVRVQDASGTYLGYNPNTGQGWVLSARHIFEDPTSIRVAGVTYAVNDLLPGVNPPDLYAPTFAPTHNGFWIPNTDLVLYSIGGNPGDPALPTLPAVPLLELPVPVGAGVLMTGRGLRAQDPEDTTPPYSAGSPGVSDAIPFRWGTNVVEGVGDFGPGGSDAFFTDFDEVGTAFEAAGVQGDSGSGTFFLVGSDWQLGGVPFGATNASLASFDDQTAFTLVSTYRDQILAATGNLIPEPSASVLAGLGFIGWAMRRRRP